MISLNVVEDFSEHLLQDAFPTINRPITPFGNRILVQIRYPRIKTASGIVITADTVEDIYRNEQTAKVIAIGAGAFIFPSNGEPWPSGRWFEVNDYVRVPLHGGDNHWTTTGEGETQKKILFKSFKDYEIIGRIEGNPLDIKTNFAYF